MVGGGYGKQRAKVLLRVLVYGFKGTAAVRQRWHALPKRIAGMVFHGKIKLEATR